MKFDECYVVMKSPDGSDSCWQWIKGKDGEGYGRIYFNDENTPAHKNKNATHCVHGHEFTSKNTLVCDRYGKRIGKINRQCRTCNRERMRARRAAKKAA